MRKYEKKVIPEQTKDIQTHLVCDICEHAVKSNSDDWQEYGYRHNEITIEHDDGYVYPEGAWGKRIKFDICPKCWDGLVLPWLLNNCKTQPDYEDYPDVTNW